MKTKLMGIEAEAFTPTADATIAAIRGQDASYVIHPELDREFGKQAELFNLMVHAFAYANHHYVQAWSGYDPLSPSNVRRVSDFIKQNLPPTQNELDASPALKEAWEHFSMIRKLTK